MKSGLFELSPRLLSGKLFNFIISTQGFFFQGLRSKPLILAQQKTAW